MKYRLLFIVFWIFIAADAQHLILKNGDQFDNIIVISGQQKTNEDQVTFLTEDENKLIVSADDLQEYYWRGRYYYSIIPQGEDRARIIRYLLHGPISLAESTNAYFDKTFYLIKDNIFYSLEEYRYSIDVFMLDLMTEYADFRKSYSRKIFYDAKSLFEMVSNYNTFIAPETFNKQKLDYEHRPKLSLLGAYNLNFIEDTKIGEPLKQNYSWSAGMMVNNKYSPYVSFQASLFYIKSLISSPAQIVRINSISLDPSLIITVFRNKQTVLWVGPYLSAQFHFYSSIEQVGFPFNPRNIDGVSIGVYLYSYLEINRTWSAFIKYGSHKFPVSYNGSLFIRGDLSNRFLQLGGSRRLFK